MTDLKESLEEILGPYSCGKAHPGADIYHPNGHTNPHLEEILQLISESNREAGLLPTRNKLGEEQDHPMTTSFEGNRADKSKPVKRKADNNQVANLLLAFANNFAEQDEDGNWWGYDTNLGDCKEAFELAIKRVKELL